MTLYGLDPVDVQSSRNSAGTPVVVFVKTIVFPRPLQRFDGPVYMDHGSLSKGFRGNHVGDVSSGGTGKNHETPTAPGSLPNNLEIPCQFIRKLRFQTGPEYGKGRKSHGKDQEKKGHPPVIFPLDAINKTKCSGAHGKAHKSCNGVWESGP